MLSSSLKTACTLLFIAKNTLYLVSPCSSTLLSFITCSLPNKIVSSPTLPKIPNSLNSSFFSTLAVSILGSKAAIAFAIGLFEKLANPLA